MITDNAQQAQYLVCKDNKRKENKNKLILISETAQQII